MKKLIALILLALLIGPLSNAIAQDTWYEQQEVTLAWDSVNTFTNGTAIPSGNEVSYTVFIKDAQATNATKIKMGTTQNTQYNATLNEGEWYVGVKANRLDSSGNVLSDSEINWSNEPTGVNQTFAVRFYKSPAACTGLRVQ